MTDALEVRIWNDYGRNISAPCINADNLLAVSCHEAGAVVQILTQPGHSDCVYSQQRHVFSTLFSEDNSKNIHCLVSSDWWGDLAYWKVSYIPHKAHFWFDSSIPLPIFDLGFKGESPCRLNKSWITKERWTVENLWRAYTTCVRAFVRAYEYVQRSKRPTGINEVSICPLGPDERADVWLWLL